MTQFARNGFQLERRWRLLLQMFATMSTLTRDEGHVVGAAGISQEEELSDVVVILP